MPQLRLASFNVENLFERAKAMNRSLADDERRTVLEQQAQVNALIAKDAYDDADKAQIVQLLTALGMAASDEGPLAILRQNKGHLVRRPHTGGLEVVASGRADWVGSVELKTEPVDEVAIENTARVIHDVGAQVQAVVEVESRPVLTGFNATLLAQANAAFEHVMLIDGNDDRGIDVGILARGGWQIASICSHVDDADAHGVIFSRDCPAYTLVHADGTQLVVLVNHLKSKGYGEQAANDARRRRQAVRIAEIYQALRAAGQEHVAVLGDFNDTPDSPPLAPLLDHTDLQDITVHAAFTGDGHPGTFANGATSNKIDYVLLSPALFAKVTGGAIFRQGVWGGAHGDLWPHYPSMTSAAQAASDHAAIYADLDL